MMTTPRIPTLRTIVTQVNAVQERATVRCLSEADCQEARDVFKAFLLYCAKNGLQNPTLTMDAGAVANSYKYRADTTQLILQRDDTQEGSPITLTAHRTWGRKRPHGGPGLLRLAVTKPEDGRTWKQLQPFRFQKKGYTFNNFGYLYL
jgi:hypothetical protein